MASVAVALASPSSAHTNQTDRWGLSYGQHFHNTLHGSPTWEYAQAVCYDAWPGGYTSTSAKNVSYGLGQWNEEYLKGVNGQDIDFRYSIRSSCSAPGGINLYVRLEILDPGVGGSFTKSTILSPPDHIGVATLRIASRSDIYYGGCCPTWQGSSDSRFHVQHIASHEGGHGHGYLPPGYHSPTSQSVMYGSLSPGVVIRPGQNIYDREMMDDQYPINSSRTFVALVALSLTAGCAADQESSAATDIVIEGLRLEYSIEKLATESESIAIVRVVQTEDRINNAANELFDPDRDLVHHISSLEPMKILRGEEVREVIQTGGQVGDFRVTVIDTELLSEGKTYLLFLTDWLWPFGGDYVAGYGITGGPIGIFVDDGGDWINGDGRSMSLAEIEDLISAVPNDPDAGVPIRPSELEAP